MEINSVKEYLPKNIDFVLWASYCRSKALVQVWFRAYLEMDGVF